MLLTFSQILRSRTSESKGITVIEAPLAPPVSESVDPEYAANLRRATLASTVGSALEYYDFAHYGLASAPISSQLFFSRAGVVVPR